MSNVSFPSLEFDNLSQWPGDIPFIFNKSAVFPKKDKNKILVFFGGSVPPKTALAEIHHQRWSWESEFKQTSIYIPDLLVNKATGVRLGWYVGRKEGPSFENYINSIVTPIKSLNINAKIVAIGSSGGGFAAIMAGLLGIADQVIAVNPQTNVLSYRPLQVKKFLTAYGADKESLTEDDLKRLALEYHLKKLDRRTRIHYVQNLSDDFHYYNHCMPFIKAVSRLGTSASTNYSFHFYEDDAGHEPPEKARMVNMIKRFLR